ncbi:NAC domain-containing protein 104-like [Humulus lupulus]|uniref:NAC domain-containing protein 104-like n=1 Tax=Humulus lupulus TaxID=3486 RepID=UPI002B402557|nr:NAC domain-containing protein 104-like [Humulus lupulus]
MGDNQDVKLPPGFRFCPTDEELILQFLYPKVFLIPSTHLNIIPDLDLHLYHPREFTGTALSSGNMHYFFSKTTEDKATSNGYWKEMDINEPIFVSGANNKVGVKKYYVYFVINHHESPTSVTETNWIMEEYNLCNNLELMSTTSPTYKRRRKLKLDFKWVLCRVHERKLDDISLQSVQYEDDDNGTELSCLDEMFLSSLDDDLDEISMQILD